MNASPLPDSHPLSLPDLQDAIRRRAEQIYIRGGRIPGRDLENWRQAEQEIMQEIATRAGEKGGPLKRDIGLSGETLGKKRRAVIVRVQGVQYIGEYNPEFSAGYTPGEFGSGASVPVRIDGDKMFLTRPNGTELETTIVQRSAK